MRRPFTHATFLGALVGLAALIGLSGCSAMASFEMGAGDSVAIDAELNTSLVVEPDKADGVVEDSEPEQAASPRVRGPEDYDAMTLPPAPPRQARDVEIVDEPASLDLGAQGVPLTVADIPTDPGYAVVPNIAGHYYFFEGEILTNPDGGVNWYVKVPAAAEPKLWDTNAFHMVDAEGIYTLKYVLWSYAEDNGDVTYLLYDPEFGPACQGDCEELVGTPAGRFVAIAPGQ